ncbi:MAG: DNA recombination protein RmuC [Hyphomicrobiales bacterium]|nr:DNA recombination protein RmuC [Hyphomicrobiales bacterium]
MTESSPMVALLAVLVAGAALAALAVMLWRTRKPASGEDGLLTELRRSQGEAATRLEAMIGLLAKNQSQLAHTVNERLDSVSHRLGDSLEQTRQKTAENMQKLHERLAVIDSAQKNITALATQVTWLQGVLANKQERGAFGQGRMELIVSDGLPKGCYEFQYTLSNKTRPDCALFLPGQRPLVVDAKFPLEGVTAFKDAKSDDERRQAAARVRQDVTRHVSDIAQKYLIPGETQDIALMFVPSESLYADLHDGFDDLVQKAFRAKVVIVSPSLLMVAVHLIQQMRKEERMREAAGQIQAEVGRLIDDVVRMHERVLKLQQHYTQVGEDVRQIVISAEKVEKRGARITDVEFIDDGPQPEVAAAPLLRKLEAGE